jgi:Mg2+-importing ATPase
LPEISHAVEPSGILKLAIVAVAVLLPYTGLGKLLHFTPLPLSLLATIALLAVTYLMLVQVVKSWFYRRHALL